MLGGCIIIRGIWMGLREAAEGMVRRDGFWLGRSST